MKKYIDDLIFNYENDEELDGTPLNNILPEEIKIILYDYIRQQNVIDRLSRKIQTQKQRIRKLMNEDWINKSRIRWFIYRENKLQMIEQMFKSGSVDLSELDKLVRGTK